MQTQAREGRKPSKIILPPRWRNTILAMYKNGASDKEIKLWIRIKRGSFSEYMWRRWLREEPKFAEVIESGRIYAEAWWLRKGREWCVGPSKLHRIRARVFIMTMKNRFGWK